MLISNRYNMRPQRFWKSLGSL